MEHKIGQVIRIEATGDAISKELMELAEKLQNCYAAKTLWKDWNKVNIDPELSEEIKQEIANTDYVEWIILHDNTIIWSDGNYVVHANIADLVIEPAILHNYSEKADKIRIALRPGAIIGYYDDFEEVRVLQVNDDGYCGYSKVKETKDKYGNIVKITIELENINEKLYIRLVR